MKCPACNNDQAPSHFLGGNEFYCIRCTYYSITIHTVKKIESIKFEDFYIRSDTDTTYFHTMTNNEFKLVLTYDRFDISNLNKVKVYSEKTKKYLLFI